MKKEFDSVKSMREIRERLNKEYSKNPGLRKKRLKKIHNQYGIVNQNPKIHKVSEKTEDIRYQITKSFNSVKFFREVKEKIAEETAGMSFEELKKYISRKIDKSKPGQKRKK